MCYHSKCFLDCFSSWFITYMISDYEWKCWLEFCKWQPPGVWVSFHKSCKTFKQNDNSYCLEIHKRKTLERQTHLSDESAIKTPLLDSFKILGLFKSSHRFRFCILWRNSNTSRWETLLGTHPPRGIPLTPSSSLEGEGCWKAEKGWGGAVKQWLITRKK